jgi:hypothetical protein
LLRDNSQLIRRLRGFNIEEMKKINVCLLLITLGLMMTSCKKDKDETTQNYPYNVRMTDAPGPYGAVYIDLKGVEITGNDGKTVVMNVNDGIYNLLDFSNGADTLIASGILTDATVQQIRLILGTNNSVIVDGISHPLSTPSADQSGLKLQVHQTLLAGITYSVLLDFDANKSIVDQGNGTYKLKPVLRTIETALSGSIRGKISPAGGLAIITATSASNLTYSSNVATSGDFLIMGLPPGIYSVTVTPVLPLNPVTQSNIAVTTGVSTNVGTIVL